MPGWFNPVTSWKAQLIKDGVSIQSRLRRNKSRTKARNIVPRVVICLTLVLVSQVFAGTDLEGSGPSKSADELVFCSCEMRVF